MITRLVVGSCCGGGKKVEVENKKKTWRHISWWKRKRGIRKMIKDKDLKGGPEFIDQKKGKRTLGCQGKTGLVPGKSRRPQRH